MEFRFDKACPAQMADIDNTAITRRSHHHRAARHAPGRRHPSSESGSTHHDQVRGDIPVLHFCFTGSRPPTIMITGASPRQPLVDHYPPRHPGSAHRDRPAKLAIHPLDHRPPAPKFP
jgi:hypothetical protein